VGVLRFLLPVLLVLLVGCTGSQAVREPAIDLYAAPGSNAAEQRDLLVGRWFGEAPLKGGGRRIWLTELRDDGSFTIQFAVRHPDGRLQHQTEVGMWGVDGPIHFTITTGWVIDGTFKPANLRDASLYDAYTLIELTPERRVYRDMGSTNHYSSRRVAADFVLPDVASLP